MLLVALAVAAAGCGDKSSEPPGSASAKDPGRDVVGALVDAAAAGDSKAIWALLSRPSKRRLGPTEAAFAKSNELRALRRQLAPFRDGKLPVQISENIDDVFGVVALSRGSNAWAAPIRNEGDLWRVELGGPLRIDVSGPPPSSRGKFLKQIGIETHGPSGPASACFTSTASRSTRSGSKARAARRSTRTSRVSSRRVCTPRSPSP